MTTVRLAESPAQIAARKTQAAALALLDAGEITVEECAARVVDTLQTSDLWLETNWMHPFAAVRILAACRVSNPTRRMLREDWTQCREAVEFVLAQGWNRLTLQIVTELELDPGLLRLLVNVPEANVERWDVPEWLAERYPHALSPTRSTFTPRAIAAAHSDTPPDVLVALRRTRSANVRAALVRHMQPHELAVAAASKHAAVRLACARNPATPLDSLADLAADSYPEVREGLLENPSTPEHLRVEVALTRPARLRPWIR